MKKRITDKHPHKRAFEELCAKANELGIRIDFLGHVTVVAINGALYDFEDLENGGVLDEFPPSFDYQLVFEASDPES